MTPNNYDQKVFDVTYSLPLRSSLKTPPSCMMPTPAYLEDHELIIHGNVNTWVKKLNTVDHEESNAANAASDSALMALLARTKRI